MEEKDQQSLVLMAHGQTLCHSGTLLPNCVGDFCCISTEIIDIIVWKTEVWYSVWVGIKKYLMCKKSQGTLGIFN